jgi:hypothetical protein
MLTAITIVALLFVSGLPTANVRGTEQEPTQSQPSSSSNPQPAKPDSASVPCSSGKNSISSKTTDCAPSAVGKQKHRKHPPSSAAKSETGSTTVVHNGSTSEPIVAISPTQTQQQASQELSTTTQLLANADANLKQVARRQLSNDEEETVKQIQVYMVQARTAIKNGEAQRAYTLANKANLLSADLAGPQR